MKITRLHTLREINRHIDALNSREYVVVDLETTGLDAFTDKLLTIVLSGLGPKEAVVFDGKFAHALLDLTTTLVLHNYKFDYTFLYRKGIDLRHLWCWDTMLIHHLLNENKSHKLDDIIKEHFHDPYKETFWTTYKSYSEAPQAEADQYAGKDVIYTGLLFDKMRSAYKSESLPDSLLSSVHRFSRALLDTELLGVRIDLDYLQDLGLKHLAEIEELRRKLHESCPAETARLEEVYWGLERDKRKTDKGKAGVKRPTFSFDSNPQVQDLLYGQLKLPKQLSKKKTPTVDDAALETLAALHAVPALLRDYRTHQKLFTAFIEATIDRAVDGTIYPSFNVNGTVTGRISASNPNLQQLPAHGGIRGIYTPKPGYSFIGADFSQLEVTIAAHFSLDPSLLSVLNDGASLHDITAKGLGIPRSTAKTINFALQYGAGAHKIKSILGCTMEEAETALKKYWDTYPGLAKLVKECHAKVDSGQFIVNPFGRRRRLIPENPKDKWEVEALKRQAFSSLIQGTGADITNLAFTQAAELLQETGDGRALFVVHDEILIEVKDECVPYWNTKLKDIMEQVGRDINLRVPLKAEPSGGMKRWQD